MTHPPSAGRFESRIRRSTRTLAIWTGSWLLSTALLAFGPKFLWAGQNGLTYAAGALNIAFGVGMVLATRAHLNDLDELLRKVLFEAMAITLGVTVILGLPYELLDNYELVPIGADFSHLMILMSLTAVAATIIGVWRYR